MREKELGERRILPFTALVGQEKMKKALILNAINPKLCGVLIRGEKGTAKSTAVRALAQLLPEIRVARDCLYSCHPESQLRMCDDCRLQREKGEEVPAISRKVRVVDLPISATEDRVVGGIDFERALRDGQKRIAPGLLAQANRGILYIDEVNLLDDHLVDLLLDTAISGVNLIEREGISLSHPAEFILVGTMNPEEGELRPQLLDRFGLCVTVEGIIDLEERAQILKRQERFDQDPQSFLEGWESAQEKLRQQIVQGQQFLSETIISRQLLEVITHICLQNRAAGHRADILMQRTACTLAAFYGRKTVELQDLLEAADLVLPHRARPSSTSSQSREPSNGNRPDTPEGGEGSPEEAPRWRGGASSPEGEDLAGQELVPSAEGFLSPPQDPADTADSSSQAGIDSLDPGERRPGEGEEGGPSPLGYFEVGNTFQVRPIHLRRDRRVRREPGRRSPSRTSSKSGRYVRSTPERRNNDLAFDATIRAAAPHQQKRPRREVSIVIEKEDIREKVRERKIGNLLLFVVDASGSMGTTLMTETKGAIMSLLLDAYQKRDRVGFVAFREAKAEVLLPPTDSIELAKKLLEDLPTGGKTPLSEGILSGYEVILQQLRKDPNILPLMIVISDCRANVPLSESRRIKPPSPGKGFAYVVSEVFEVAQKIRQDGRIKAILIDVNEELTPIQLSMKLADALGAQYFKLEDLRAHGILEVIESQRTLAE